MDASRFKRREIQTKRQTVERISKGPVVVSEMISARPAQPGRRLVTLDSLQVNVATPSQPSAASKPKAATPQPALNPVAALQPKPARVKPHGKQSAIARPGRQLGKVGKAALRAEAESETLVLQQHLPPIDMDLPGNNSPLRQAFGSLQGKKQRSSLRRWSMRAASLLIALVVGVGGLLFSQGYISLHKAFKSNGVTAAALKANVNPDLLKGEGDGRVNVLLLGRGGGDHDGPDLTDTMMLDSIDPVNHTSTLLSIPRDLWVDIPNAGAMKINAAWETGEFQYLGKIAPGSTDKNAIQAGFNEVDQTVESVLGVTIDYNALVNFQAFQQAVDTVGGVSVNVPTDLVDPTMAWQNGGNPVLAKAGVDAFDGAQALNYVRSRETTSDFARAQRQRAVMVALKSRVATAGTLSNPLKIANLVKTFGNNVQTDLSLKDATRLYGIVNGISDSKTSSIGLADAPNNYITTGTMAGQSIDLPSAGLFDYSGIQGFVRTQLKDPYIIKENAKILILNGTNLPGIASNEENVLKSYGYNVIGTGDAPTSDWQQTTVVDLSHGKDKYTTHYLEQRFNVSTSSTLPDQSIQTNGANFVIIIGSDEATPTQT